MARSQIEMDSTLWGWQRWCDLTVNCLNVVRTVNSMDSNQIKCENYLEENTADFHETFPDDNEIR